MAYRRKGGSALMALARRRRLKAAKDKEGKLDAMVIKPTLSRLRTGVVSKRKKGGQALVALAKRRKPAIKKKPAAKRPASSQPSKFGARIPVESRSPATKAQRKRKAKPTKTKKSAVPPSLPKNIRGKIPYHKALVAYAKENPVETALTFLPVGGVAGLGLKAVKAASKAKKASDVVRGIGATRTASAASRTSGLGKAALKKKSALSSFLKKAKRLFKKGDPKSAFDKLKKTHLLRPK